MSSASHPCWYAIIFWKFSQKHDTEELPGKWNMNISTCTAQMLHSVKCKWVSKTWALPAGAKGECEMWKTSMGRGDQTLSESKEEALNTGSKHTYQLQHSGQATHLSGPPFASNTTGILPTWQVCCDAQSLLLEAPLCTHLSLILKPKWTLRDHSSPLGHDYQPSIGI